MSLDGCSNPPCLGACIRERQVVLAKEPRGLTEGFQEGAEALTHEQKISREQPSLGIGAGLVPRSCLSPAGLWLLGARRAEGGCFLAREKKKKSICFQFSSSHSGWLQETCALPPETPQLLQQLQSTETPSLCHPPLPQNKAEQGK